MDEHRTKTAALAPSDAVRAYRPTLLSIAYRMTGELMVSEDIVQDVFLKWMNLTPEAVQDISAYLAKSVINASLNHLARVKRQREAYKGIWLPEPVLMSSYAIDAKLDISYGFMRLLETLSPLERAVFILKESFDFAYAELAELFDTSEANGRQLYKRAKEKMAGDTRRFTINPDQQQALLDAFVKAAETGDTEWLIRLLKTDVVIYSDGGGKALAALKPLYGSAIASTFLRSVATRQGDQLTARPALINGEAALLFFRKEDRVLTTVMVIEADTSGIQQLYFIRNPDKLAHLQEIFG
ncbi:sigma-70 family RNA polymerase sigma factor [Spirosoma koreense]